MRIVIALLLLITPALADTPQEESVKAKQFYEKGMARFQLEEYDAAIGLWQDGFRVKPVPEFLYNIAQAYRLSKRPEKALAFYKRYLNMSPQAANRREVENQIASLNRIVKEQASVASAPPTNALGPGEHRPGEEPPPPAEPPPVVTPAPAAVVVVAAPPPKPVPVYKKGWFWGVVAGAAVVVIAVGVGVGVGAQPGNPNATFGMARGN